MKRWNWLVIIVLVVILTGCASIFNQQNIDTVLAEIEAWQASQTNDVPSPGDTDGIPAVVPGYPSSGFLERDAQGRVHNGLAGEMSDAEHDATAVRHAAHGFTEMPYSLLNQGDGSPVPTTFYKHGFSGEVDPVKVKMMRQRIIKVKQAGFLINLWGPLDDSPEIAKFTPDQILQLYRDMVENFGDLADSWCLALEIDEWGKHWIPLMPQAVDILQTTDKPVGMHTTSYKMIQLAKDAGCDTFYAQVGWLQNTDQMNDRMDWLNKNKGTLEIIMCEFNRDSTTPLATALATAAYRKGAAGTQTGRPKITPPPVASADAFPYEELNWGSRHQKPRGDVKLDPNQTLVIHSVKRDITTFTASKRPESRYPHEQDNGAIDGRCYIFNKNGSGSFFDSIRPNQNWRDFKNIKNGYCKGFTWPGKGEPIFMFIAGIDGKWRGPIAKGIVE